MKIVAWVLYIFSCTLINLFQKNEESPQNPSSTSSSTTLIQQPQQQSEATTTATNSLPTTAPFVKYKSSILARTISLLTPSIPEQGRSLFNHFVKFKFVEFHIAIKRAHNTFKANKYLEDNKKVDDKTLAKQITTKFVETFCQTQDEVFKVTRFLEEQIQGYVQQEKNFSTPETSALLKILRDAHRGENEESIQDKIKQTALQQRGELILTEFINQLTASQRQVLNEAANTALLNLESHNNPINEQEIRSQFSNGRHQWDFSTHQLIESPDEEITIETSHYIVENTIGRKMAASRRDLMMLELQVFVEKLFDEEDQAAVFAHFEKEIFKEITIIKCKELYIHCSDGWGGRMHNQIYNNLKAIFEEFRS